MGGCGLKAERNGHRHRHPEQLRMVCLRLTRKWKPLANKKKASRSTKSTKKEETPPKGKKEGPRVITKYSVFMKTSKSELMTMFKDHIPPPKTATSRAAQSEGKRAGKRKRAAEVPAPEETAPAAVSNDILEKKWLLLLRTFLHRKSTIPLFPLSVTITRVSP